MGQPPSVPVANRAKYVVTLIEAYLGNGYGVSTAAAPIYEELIEAFSTDEALLELTSFTHPVIASSLQMQLSQSRWATLLSLLRPRVTGEAARVLLAALDAYTGPMHSAAKEANLRRAVAPILAA